MNKRQTQTQSQEFELPYWVESLGDGSVAVYFEPTLDEAIEKDRNQEERWGDSSAAVAKLKVENGKLFFKTYKFVKEKYTEIWVEVKSTK